jgi:hypothetical protein
MQASTVMNTLIIIHMAANLSRWLVSNKTLKRDERGGSSSSLIDLVSLRLVVVVTAKVKTATAIPYQTIVHSMSTTQPALAMPILILAVIHLPKGFLCISTVC